MKGEWQRVKLGDIIRIKHGWAFPGNGIIEEDNDQVLVTPGNFNIGGGFKENNKKYYRGEYPTEYKFQGGEIIVTMTDLSKTSDTLGYSARVPCSKSRCYLHNQRIGLVQFVNKNVDKGFIYWLLRSSDYHERIVATASGTTVKHTSPSRIAAYEISLPPLPTQRRIAAVLGALDDKIELNRKMNANLEAQAQALFKSLPRFEETPFLSLIDLLSGGTPRTDNPEYWNGDIPFFSPKDVGNPFAISTERYVTTMGVENCNSACYPAYTTFITARGTVGKVCMAGVPMAMNQSCFALSSKDIHPLLVYFYALESVSSLKKKSNGAVFDAITIREFKTEVIRRAKIEDEKRFVALVRTMYELMLKNIFESRKLAELRDALLPKLMSGELEVAG